MDLSDEDPFAVSDEEPMQTDNTTCNPVEEHLLKQRHDIMLRVEKAKSNLADMQQVKERILDKLNSRAICGASSSSDTETELYQVTGEPVLKKRRVRRTAGLQQPLTILNVWQKVVDDKWVAGVVLKNTSHRILENPCMYVFVKKETEIHGTTSFWRAIDESLWEKTDELDFESEKLVATVVFDLPSFENDEFIEAFATVVYDLDGKQLQTAVTTFRLTGAEAIDRSLAPRFNANVENAVLAIKAISVERSLAISLEGDAGRGLRLFEFLEKIGFKEILTDVYVSKHQESFRHCIFEILTPTETQVPVRISARSASQLEIIVRMTRKEIPEANELETENKLLEAAFVLESELELEFDGADAERMRVAKIHTDLMIP